MEYRRIGRSGLKVSEICVGTMTFGYSTDEVEAKSIVDLALDAGVNFFDTANSYGKGQSEVLLGKALKGKRRDVIVATKFFNPVGPGPNDSGTSRVHIMNAIEDSLKRLGMDYVDIYYVHHSDVQAPLEEMLGALDNLVRQGKVRYIACSNYPAYRLSDALWISETRNLGRFECYSPQYSLVVRDIEQEIVPLCLERGLGIIAWAPLAGGFLSGKYTPGVRAVPGARSESSWGFPECYFASNADQILDTLLGMAADLKHSAAQVALRWVLAQPGVTSAIIGPRTAEQARNNLLASTWRLEGEALEHLNEVSYLPLRYPESKERKMYVRRDEAVKMASW
jgi:aryl-alcohol dehydrogenase-like predicted oxidoreductase